MAANSIAVVYDCLFPYTTGGGERLYRSYAERMQAAGRSVDYLTAEQWNGSVPTDTSFRIRRITSRLRLYDTAGVRRTPAALVFAGGIFRALARSRRNYDAVIVSGLPVLNVFATRAALLGTRTEIVVDYLEVWGRTQWVEYAGRLTGSIAWMLQRLAIGLTTVATCHSELTARQLRAEGFTGTLLLSPGLIESDSPAAFSGTAASPPYALYAGRHIPDKRVEVLPAAVAEARKLIPDLRLVILGSGTSSDLVTREVARVGGESWIDLPGFVSEDDLAQLMRGATALINPSRREGYGLVVVEAAAHGTPVILVADDGNAATELISPGENGFIAASTEPAELAAAVVKTARGGEKLRATTRAWYEVAVRTRTLDRTVHQILSTVDTMTNRPRHRQPARGKNQQGHL
jgi:glycosyltransferase involved in cell wall biosynthesis